MSGSDARPRLLESSADESALVRSISNQQRLDPLGVCRRRRIVDYHTEIRSAVDGEGRKFEGERTENRVAYMLHGLEVAATNIVLRPHRLELRAEPAQLVDQRFHVSRSTGAGCI